MIFHEPASLDAGGHWFPAVRWWLFVTAMDRAGSWLVQMYRNINNECTHTGVRPYPAALL